MDFFELTNEPLDITNVARRVVPPECGATVTLDGYVRQFTKGRETLYLEYEAYEPMAIKEMEKLVETSDDWIASRTGIRQRHIAVEGQTTGDLAFGAAKAALEAAGVAAKDIDLIVVDCLTVWIANLLDRGHGDAAVLSEADDFAAIVGERAVALIVISNEVGEGVHPPTAIGIRFRDLLGAVNQRIAAAADLVTLMVAGIPVPIKRAAPRPPRSQGGERAFEGP